MAPEPLDLDELPTASPDVAEQLERHRPGPMTLPEYAAALKAIPVSVERLRALPLAHGPRFTLD